MVDAGCSFSICLQPERWMMSGVVECMGSAFCCIFNYFFVYVACAGGSGKLASTVYCSIVLSSTVVLLVMKVH